MNVNQPQGPSLVAWWRLIRGLNCLVAGTAAAVGAYLTSRLIDPVTAILIPLAPMLIAAAGNIHNDLLDMATDRLGHPERPLVTGKISPGGATTAMSIAYVAGLLAAAFVSWLALTIAGVVVLGLTLYNHRLSRKSLLGNIAVALMGALPILYGGLCRSGLTDPRWVIAGAAALIAFWLHLARELLKDAVDADADASTDRHTMPHIHGERLTIRLGALSMIIAAAFTVWLGVTGWLGVIFLVGVVVTVIPALLLGAAQCASRPRVENASLWASWLKVTMLAGLVWIVLGVAFP